MTRVIHAITPGDHYSPRTGSAIPTVVHGLAGAARADSRVPEYAQFVVLGANTYQPRYDSATPIEFADVPGPTRNERVADAALARVGIPRRAALRYFQPQADVLATEDPAIVLAHNAPVLPWLLRRSPHRVVLYAHNDILRSMSKGEAARTLDTVAGIVCVSESLADQTKKHLPKALADRVHVVRNGVDCSQFTPSAERDGDRLRLIFVGRAIPEKGPDILLKAAALLHRDDLEIVLVGSRGFDPSAELSAYERSLRELAAKCRVPVEFRPFEPRSALPALLRNADIMVVPSRWQEPCPLTIGEGQASGLPVIAHRVGGIPEIIGSAGMLVANEDPHGLARAISELADDPALRRRMAREARSHAEEHDWSWAWSNLRDVLDGL
jgi:glycosyltransferase involved in cell wall biosynthesis